MIQYQPLKTLHRLRIITGTSQAELGDNLVEHCTSQAGLPYKELAPSNMLGASDFIYPFRLCLIRDFVHISFT